MLRFFTCFLLSLASFQFAYLQPSRFVYIESENKEPFSVLLNGKTAYSSTINGFLTIPQLTKGGYIVTIGFAQNKYPEQEFELAIDDDDQGFLLRHLSDSRFVLQNLQTAKTIAATINQTAAIEMGTKASSEKTSGNNLSDNLSSPKTKTDTLFDMATLKAIAKNSSKTNNRKAHNREKPKLATDTLRTVVLPPKNLVDSTTTNFSITTPATEADCKELKALLLKANTEKLKLALAKKAFETKNFTEQQLRKLGHTFLLEHYKMLFFEAAKKQINNGENAFQVLMEARKNHPIAAETVVPKDASDKKGVNSPSENQALPTMKDNSKDTANLDAIIESPTKSSKRKKHKAGHIKTAIDTLKAEVVVNKEVVVPTAANSVANLATEADYKELRALFLKAKTEKSKLAMAKKAFETKNYTVQQLRKLGHTFLLAQYKMLFFEAAKNHIYDSENALQLLNDVKQPALIDQLKKEL